MAKKTRHRLPSTIYVIEQEHENILIAERNFIEFANGEIVGTYQLVATNKKRVEHSIG